MEDQDKGLPGVGSLAALRATTRPAPNPHQPLKLQATSSSNNPALGPFLVAILCRSRPGESHTFSKMSDFEDEMDIDVPAPSKDITFSSDNTTKGKRSAANLPVEAEDSLPW